MYVESKGQTVKIKLILSGYISSEPILIRFTTETWDRSSHKLGSNQSELE